MNKIQKIQKACKINDRIFHEIVHNFNFNTEKEIANYIRNQFRKYRVKPAYTLIVANNSATIHAKPRKKKLVRGFLILDFAAKYGGYCSDMTRTIFLGKANHKEKKLYAIVQRCQKQVLTKVRPGAECADLDVYARVLLGKYKKYFAHALGHGVDHKVHANPRIGPTSQSTLKEGDVVTIEPGIYVKEKNKKFGIRIEDTVYVGKRAVVLSKSPKRFIEVDIAE